MSAILQKLAVVVLVGIAALSWHKHRENERRVELRKTEELAARERAEKESSERLEEERAAKEQEVAEQQSTAQAAAPSGDPDPKKQLADGKHEREMQAKIKRL